MSKELVISSNRHETRVAILEDDQLVEIFHQREQEYSLAGSIHKGRVTRVLPGMQSAFVDIGLDRDAFLYVSDFFEDNEEYDQVVTTVEDEVLRMQKGGRPAPVAEPVPEPPGPEAPAAAAEPAAELVVSAPEAESPAAPPVTGEPARHDRGGDRGDRDRRGRRGRRRGRGRGGHGFPDSKFASPAADEAPAAAPADEEEDIIVLPGESLAKYRHPEDPGKPPVEFGGDTEDEEAAAADRSVAEAEPAPAEAAAAEPQPEPAPVEAAGPHQEVVALVSPAVEEHPGEPPTADGEPVIDAEAAEFGPPEVDSEAEALEAGEPGEGLDETAPRSPADEVEPARIPTSLTATLREHGGRYPHRVSRRLRRRQRGGPGEERSEPPPRADRPEPRDRPERPEQRDRPERGDRDRPRVDQRAAVRPERERPPQASIADLLKEGQEIIVQIAKEPLGAKGARITSYVALPGRYVVYMPTVDHVGVSRKIASDEERLRLKRILQTNRQGMPGGFILRTAGDGKTEEELRADMQFLYNLWLDIRGKAEKRKAPALVHHDLDLVQRILRDQLTSNFKNIWLDNAELYENVLSFVQRFQPALVSRVKLYTRETPIFDAFNITQELEKALRPKVWLKSGGYIVINQTEALVAIDINTGKYVGKSNRLEDTIVKTNTDAVKEIVRQIRLRDLGGIIVVDFIDMDERKNRQKVMAALEEAMRADKAPNKILSFNDFGLVAITRKRVKQSLERTLCSPCPYCDGAGYVKSVHTVIGEILAEARKYAKVVEGNDVVLRVNPEVAKVLKSNRNDHLNEIEETLGRKNVIVKSDPALHQEKFDLA